MCTSEWGECARVVLFSFSGKDVGIGAGAYTRQRCLEPNQFLFIVSINWIFWILSMHETSMFKVVYTLNKETKTWQIETDCAAMILEVNSYP